MLRPYMALLMGRGWRPLGQNLEEKFSTTAVE